MIFLLSARNLPILDAQVLAMPNDTIDGGAGEDTISYAS